ncbi:hypothetical protein RZS08_26020, partial [Arthrospira platensis SPKY1]|nr:hypothetical protein [Arthrospira platensis SPKY1]
QYAAKRQRELWQVSEAEARRALLAAGVQFHAVDAGPFRDRIAPMRQALAEDEAFRKLLHAIDVEREVHHAPAH